MCSNAKSTKGQNVMGSKTAAIMAEVRASNEKALEARQKPASNEKRVESYSYCLGTGESHVGPRRQPYRYTGEGAPNSDWDKEATKLCGIPVLREDNNVIGSIPPQIPMATAVAFLRGFPVFSGVDEKVLRLIVKASHVNPRIPPNGRPPHKVEGVIGSCAVTRNGRPGVLTGVKVPVVWCTCRGLEGRFCLQHDKSKGRQSYV